jgi:hypothetical protein
MLLTRIVREAKDDRGSGLVAVIALTLVTAIIGVTVGAVTVHSLQTTNGVAGSVEARAAALAGIAEAELLLRQGEAGADGCPAGGVLQSSGTPAFDVEIYADDLANGWTTSPSCPSADSTRVKFVATGFADRATPGAGARGGQVVMEAIYQFVPIMTEIETIDPAVYAYQIEGDLKNFTLGVEPNTVIASDIQIRIGNFLCTNGASVAGSVILAEGHAALDSCSVSGNLYVSDYISINSKRNGFAESVAGNAIAAGNQLLSGRAVELTSNAVVGGDVFAGGSVALSASPGGTRVAGNVTAARNTSTSVTVANNTQIDGNTLATGSITGNASNFGGTRSPNLATLTPPPAPLVPNWVDLPFTSDTASIQASTWWERGFQNVVTWSGSCVLSGSDPRWSALNAYTNRTIIDATACTTPIEMRSNLSPTVQLQTDVVVFARSFDFNSLPVQASNPTDARRMYFVVPDNAPDSLPTCSGGAGDIYYNNEANINAPLALFFYTPCKVLSDRNFMRGQIYGGSVEFRQQAQWTFVPATPPGVDFTAGVDTEPVQTGAFLGNRLTLRELSNGG